MRVFGVVTECNPLHAGHRSLIRQAREAGADALIAVLSGSFVQRGEPAILSKFDRAAEMADAGFDLVLELPVSLCLSSAQRFAEGAVSMLAAAGVVDTLLFGSESGSLDALSRAAALLEQPDVLDEIRRETETGASYPAAQQAVAAKRLGDADADLLKKPNNILAVEYLRAIWRRRLPLAAKTVLRPPGAPSAHGVRADAAAGLPLGGRVSQNTARLLAGGGAVDLPLFEKLAMARLRELSPAQFASLPDTGGGLAERMERAAKTAGSFTAFCEAAKTKRYTMSRVKRAAVWGVLGLSTAPGTDAPYLRVLAIGAGGKALLREMRSRASLPFGEKLLQLAKTSPLAAQFAAEERRATDFYNFLRKEPLPVGEDLTRRLYVTEHELSLPV